MSINLKGLNKAAVLAALYNASKPQGMGFLHYDPTPMSVEEAEALLKQCTYFDYLKGRVMKVDLKGDTLDPWGYDRDNGEGAAEAAIQSLQSTEDANNPLISKMHADNTFLSAVQTQAHLDEASQISSDGSAITLNLGFADVKDVLEPKVKKAKEENESK